MSHKTQSIANYVNPKAIHTLATPSNLRLGQEIAEGGGVELIESSPLSVIAKVRPAGGQRRRVELRSTEDGLTWKCSCTRTGLFCQHCVAAALASLGDASKC
ncbi:MAG: SWIM zinc finger family protein [Chloroflexi bacterium]|nr:SWIM zinc finger family protein [Chloroflexota bacterium]